MTEWHKTSEPPKQRGVYPVLVDELGEPTKWLGEFWPDRNEWVDPFCDDITLRVIRWMDWPPFVPEEAQR